MEQGLVLRQRLFGTDSQEASTCSVDTEQWRCQKPPLPTQQVWTACKTVGELCNFLAMTHLRDGEFKMTEMLLKKAEILHQVIRGGTRLFYIPVGLIIEITVFLWCHKSTHGHNLLLWCSAE